MQLELKLVLTLTTFKRQCHYYLDQSISEFNQCIVPTRQEGIVDIKLTLVGLALKELSSGKQPLAKMDTTTKGPVWCQSYLHNSKGTQVTHNHQKMQKNKNKNKKNKNIPTLDSFLSCLQERAAIEKVQTTVGRVKGGGTISHSPQSNNGYLWYTLLVSGTR